MTTYHFIVDHSDPQDRKVIQEFGKKIMFDIKQKGRKSPTDRSLIENTEKWKSPVIMASGFSTIF